MSKNADHSEAVEAADEDSAEAAADTVEETDVVVAAAVTVAIDAVAEIDAVAVAAVIDQDTKQLPML